jgi:hypothetical protein
MDLLKALEQFCRDAAIKDSPTVARQILLLVNGYLIMEPLLGKAEALRLVLDTVRALVPTGTGSATPARINCW